MNQVCSSCCEIHKLAFLSTSRQVIRRNCCFVLAVCAWQNLLTDSKLHQKSYVD
ncbi:hypothetical protein Plhal304r1_c054g0139601 [Plasmopara halstedii]